MIAPRDISKKEDSFIKEALFQFISRIGMKLWSYKCLFYTLYVVTYCR